ncbi:Uncharacterised protein [Mycobacterium tuberculosis]|nr:Uncharacterised protein [Mycobacterium tuberculosis]
MPPRPARASALAISPPPSTAAERSIVAGFRPTVEQCVLSTADFAR